MTSFRSRCRVVSTELFPPVVVVPSAKSQFSSFGAENLSSQCKTHLLKFDKIVSIVSNMRPQLFYLQFSQIGVASEDSRRQIFYLVVRQDTTKIRHMEKK